MKRKKPKIELRYYYMPAGSPILPLLGERWVQNYGTGIEDLHFHNFMEIGFCYYGEGILTLGEEKRKFTGRQFTVIPERFPHTTNSMGNTVCKWEYLFVDVEGFLRKNCESAVQAEKMLRRINAGALLMNEKEEPFIAECIIRIMDIMRREEEFYIQEASGLLMALLAGIARLNRTPEQEMLYEEQSRSMRIISDTLDYISDHYRENIKIEQLSANCHLSESHFRRIFSGCMHMSPSPILTVAPSIPTAIISTVWPTSASFALSASPVCSAVGGGGMNEETAAAMKSCGRRRTPT